MKSDKELLERIANGGDVHEECTVNCPECYKNGNCELQNTSALRKVPLI